MADLTVKEAMQEARWLIDFAGWCVDTGQSSRAFDAFCAWLRTRQLTPWVLQRATIAFRRWIISLGLPDPMAPAAAKGALALLRRDIKRQSWKLGDLDHLMRVLNGLPSDRRERRAAAMLILRLLVRASITDLSLMERMHLSFDDDGVSIELPHTSFMKYRAIRRNIALGKPCPVAILEDWLACVQDKDAVFVDVHPWRRGRRMGAKSCENPTTLFFRRWNIAGTITEMRHACWVRAYCSGARVDQIQRQYGMRRPDHLLLVLSYYLPNEAALLFYRGLG